MNIYACDCASCTSDLSHIVPCFAEEPASLADYYAGDLDEDEGVVG